jgi:hypothetical protein
MLRMIAVLFCFAVGIAGGLRDAVFASCFFIWNDVFRPSEWARYYGVLSPSVFYPVHICTAVLAAAIIFRKWERRWNTAATVILVSLLWFFICALLAEFKDIAIERTLTSAKYFIPLAFISATLCTREAQKWFLYTLASSVGIWLAHHGLISLVSGEPLVTMAIPGGQMSDRNDFLVAGTACIPMMVYIGFRYTGRFQKWVRLGFKAAVLFSLAAFAFSESRGAIVGMTLLLLWFTFLTGRFAKRFAIGLVVAIIAIALMPSFVWERLGTIQVKGEQTEGSAAARVEHMLTAVNVTLDYPITGVGADNFPPVSLRYSVYDAEPHSLWLKCSSEYGLPMVVFFGLIVVLFLVRLRRRAALARTLGDSDGEALATTLNCALFGFLATGSFTSQFLSEYMWAILGLIGAFLATPLQPSIDAVPGFSREAEAVAAGARAA